MKWASFSPFLEACYNLPALSSNLALNGCAGSSITRPSLLHSALVLLPLNLPSPCSAPSFQPAQLLLFSFYSLPPCYCRWITTTPRSLHTCFSQSFSWLLFKNLLLRQTSKNYFMQARENYGHMQPLNFSNPAQQWRAVREAACYYKKIHLKIVFSQWFVLYI